MASSLFRQAPIRSRLFCRARSIELCKQSNLLSIRRTASYSIRNAIKPIPSYFQRKFASIDGFVASKSTENWEASGSASPMSYDDENQTRDAFETSDFHAIYEPTKGDPYAGFSVLHQNPSLLDRIGDASTLERFVEEIESISPLRSVHLEWIHPLMSATSNLSSEQGAKLTERLLDACLAHITEGRSREALAKVLPYPRQEMYNMAITAWTKAITTNGYGAKRATKVLETMVEEYKLEVDFINGMDKSLTMERPIMTAAPHLINYSSVINAWAKSDTIDGPNNAENLLSELEQRSGIDNILRTGMVEGELHPLAPDLICYNTVMSAWSRSNHPNAISKVEGIMARLKKLHEITGYSRYRPDVHTYTILIDAYAKQRGPKGEVRPLQAERVLQEMYDFYTSRDRVVGETAVRPNVVAYNNVMRAWANAGQPQRAETILRALMDKPGGLTTVSVLPRTTPSLVSFHIVITGWARHGGPEAGERAEAILKLMDEVKDSDGIPMPIKPTVRTFNAVMHAWSRSGIVEGAERAESILTSLLNEEGGNQPTHISFATALHAHAMSAAEGGALRAEQVLHKQKLYWQRTRSENVRPAEPSYASVLLAWNLRSANTNQVNGLYAAEHAEAVLERFKEETGEMPSFKMFQDAIEAWARHDPHGILADGPNKVNRARLLLQQLVLERPKELSNNSLPFGIMLRVCTTPMPSASLRREAFFTAIDSYNRLQADDRFSTQWIIYMEMFNMLKVQLPEKRDAMFSSLAESIFHDCCDDGWLGPSTIKAALACNHLPDHLVQLLSGSRNTFPEMWSEKVWKN